MFELESYEKRLGEWTERLVRELSSSGHSEARALDKDSPWWHAWWVTYLIANGTLAEAEHAWREALRRLDPTGDRMAESSSLALHLHRSVCRRWLALGYVQEARNGLNEIAPRWLELEAELSALREIVEDHEESLRLDESVYPAEVPQHERWRVPRELDPRNAQSRPLVKWWPGRVIESDAHEVLAVIADPNAKLAQRVTFTTEEWRSAANQPAPDAAGFFELGEYEDGERIVRQVTALDSSILDDEYEALVNELRS